jgi:hypothetical protein
MKRFNKSPRWNIWSPLMMVAEVAVLSGQESQGTKEKWLDRGRLTAVLGWFRGPELEFLRTSQSSSRGRRPNVGMLLLRLHELAWDAPVLAWEIARAPAKEHARPEDG